MGLIISQNIIEDFKTLLNSDEDLFIGSSITSGKDRAKRAIKSAFLSPESNRGKIINSKSVLLLITDDTDAITIQELAQINDYILQESINQVNIIMTVAEDKNLKDSIGLIIIATGFDKENLSHEDNN